MESTVVFIFTSASQCYFSYMFHGMYDPHWIEHRQRTTSCDTISDLASEVKTFLHSPATTAAIRAWNHPRALPANKAHPLGKFQQSAESSIETIAIYTKHSVGLDLVTPGPRAECGTLSKHLPNLQASPQIFLCTIANSILLFDEL